MNLHLTLGPLFALIAGILILVMPRLLNFIVAIYLIAIGVLGLLGNVKFLTAAEGRLPSRHDPAHPLPPRDPRPRCPRREAAHRPGQLPAHAERARLGRQPEDRARPGDRGERGRGPGRTRSPEVALARGGV